MEHSAQEDKSLSQFTDIIAAYSPGSVAE